MSRKLSLQPPGRLMSELPPPKREIKETDLWNRSETDTPQGTPAPLVVGRQVMKPTFKHTRVIAYIARAPRCMYSGDLLDLAKEVDIPVQVYDIDKVDPPSWMPGTPTLETEDGAVYCGDAAFEWILTQSQKRLEQQNDLPQQIPQHHRRPQHPEIVPRTVENMQSVMSEAKPYQFLAAAPDDSASMSHKPSGGGSLNSVFQESQRLEQIASAVDQMPQQDAADRFTEMMNARA